GKSACGSASWPTGRRAVQSSLDEPVTRRAGQPSEPVSRSVGEVEVEVDPYGQQVRAERPYRRAVQPRQGPQPRPGVVRGEQVRRPGGRRLTWRPSASLRRPSAVWTIPSTKPCTECDGEDWIQRGA